MTKLQSKLDKRDDTLRRIALTGGVGAGALALANSANAESVVDLSAVTTDINDTKPEMVNVGTAMLGLVLVAVLFLMVRRVMR